MPASPHFPAIQTRSLEREGYDLPADFDGRRNVAVVAFERRQQADVDTWLPFLLDLEAAHDDVRVWEVPTISRAWSVGRWFIDGGMVQGIPDRSARERTLTSYADVGAVCAALGLADTREIAVVLTDRAGTVGWMTTGVFSSRAGEELAAALG